MSPSGLAHESADIGLDLKMRPLADLLVMMRSVLQGSLDESLVR